MQQSRACIYCGIEIYFDPRNEKNARGNPKPHNTSDGLVHDCKKVDTWEPQEIRGKTKEGMRSLPARYRKDVPPDAQML